MDCDFFQIDVKTNIGLFEALALKPENSNLFAFDIARRLQKNL
jgi:hypothetical protein